MNINLVEKLMRIFCLGLHSADLRLVALRVCLPFLEML